jgi:hypothetical protein
MDVETPSNLSLRFKSDILGIDRAAKPIRLLKPVPGHRWGRLLAALVPHESRFDEVA